ncbi:hypothetical protein PSMK_23180 [Phycisphaera mikurensis NBRC 102666]|uniref:Peptidase S55 domain-containing protein n=1 Tax=Phycisphaera mikurensis (strain NBRC 102666 / KCTC 22515 / FYK2301M01) TaxID=1142394 RepID=I0IGT9_PHYMF|nr:hypothetical protein PSMK_23180 [Phycisphaera mikurensis NBRC 102666]
MLRRRHLFLAATLAGLGIGPALAEPSDGYDPEPGVIASPQTLREEIPLEEVRVGMKGYGLSVFHGTRIESFPVEVVSVITSSRPGRSVVWVSCTDERMQKYGPVQGMSGSPIYLWDEGEAGVEGEGGRLLGAFAFGYPMTNECMVGVQPIGYMRAVGVRAAAGVDAVDGSAAGPATGNAPATLAAGLIASLIAEAEAAAAPAWARTGLDHAAGVARRTPGFAATAGSAPSAADAGPRPLALPVAVGSAELARVAAPFLRPLGLNATAGGGDAGGVGGPIPSNVDADATRIEPGSVLAIPLAFGDWTPTAAGTVTDVSPDGTVIGFGHAMDGQGDTALPLASGYTHFVVSRRDISFKQAGLLKMAGSILQDESTAVAGSAMRAFRTAPSAVRVRMPGHPDRAYAYDVVQHPGYTPFIGPLTAVVSLGAEQSPPERNTTRVTGRVAFSDGSGLDVDVALPFGTPGGVAGELGPAVSMMLTNPFERLELASMDFDLEVTPEVELAFLQDASVQPAVAQPGEEVEVEVRLQPYDAPLRVERYKVRVPVDAPDGELELLVSDASTALFRLQAARPAWNKIDSLDELREQLQLGLTFPRRAVHVSVSSEGPPELTLGESTLPGIPNTFGAVLGSSASSAARPGRAVQQSAFEVPEVVAGSLRVSVEIRRDPAG